jgi:formylglycine-generating enzyme required for sulfatase activity
MGSGTAHLVTIADFEIAKKEITASQYTACVTAGVCSDINANVACNWDIAEYGDHPINCLDWQQSADYCAWAGARLPSESEWEYAARSMGETNTYPWGEAAPSCDLAVTLLDGGDLASGGCDTDHTFAACSKTAGNTEQDLCDMAGNAGEWVQDKWDDEIEGYGHIPTDGSAYEATGTKRMYRGGAFASPQVMLENTNRNGHLDPTSQVVNIGFRCARNAP